jgi:hypothetical protein
VPWGMQREDDRVLRVCQCGAELAVPEKDAAAGDGVKLVALCLKCGLARLSTENNGT